MNIEKFDDIRPYNESEIPAAMQRIASSSAFPLVSSFVFPDENLEKVRDMVRAIKTVDEFQSKIMYHVNKQIIRKSITEFTYSGIENLTPGKSYLFVSNHRDIMLDASLMQNVLVDNGLESCQITFGANLMQGQMVIDVGKSNKMFRVERPGGSAKEFYKASLHLSEYIRMVITELHQSVWIAQRNGRTKDGIDRTDQGIIKMFGMSASGDKISSIEELNIVPVAISYEWESCDVLKAIELYERQLGPYIKKPGEDLNSILTGITQPKGRVHMEFCKPLCKEDLLPFEDSTINEFNRLVANTIDERICNAYRLTPNNYIAHDLLYGKKEFIDRYSEKELHAFKENMGTLGRYYEECNIERLHEIFLGIYAGPIESKKMFVQ